MKYAEIYNDKIIKIHNYLPDSWKNISNFNTLSTEDLYDLSAFGYQGYKFYFVEETTRPVHNRLYTLNEETYSTDEANHKVVQSWSLSPVSVEVAWNVIRAKRTAILSSTDWTQLADSPLSETEKNQYIVYRQKLRDITTQSDPFNISWPVLE